MALRASRYSKLYLQLAKPDVAHHFPRNVFVREPNKPSWRILSEDFEKLYVRQYS